MSFVLIRLDFAMGKNASQGVKEAVDRPEAFVKCTGLRDRRLNFGLVTVHFHVYRA